METKELLGKALGDSIQKLFAIANSDEEFTEEQITKAVTAIADTMDENMAALICYSKKFEASASSKDFERKVLEFYAMMAFMRSAALASEIMPAEPAEDTTPRT